jgi:hypothetical protein
MTSNKTYLLQFLQTNGSIFVNINGIELITEIRQLF